MTQYYEHRVSISNGQRDKIRKAIESKTGVSIKLANSDLIGDDLLALTKAQTLRLQKAYETGKGITIKMSKTQVRKNLKVEGGFLGMLAGLAARALPFLATNVLPALGIGALTGVANAGVSKALGNGLYLKKGGNTMRVETDGKGLYLSPASGAGLKKYGDGLYLSQDSGIVEGSGILLGPNSPLKNVPILGWLL